MIRLIFFVAFIYVFSSSFCVYARDITGVYKGEGATMTISKLDSAWEIKCSSGDSDSGYIYFDTKPFTGKVKMSYFTSQCKPVGKVDKDVYKVSIVDKKKYDCGLLGDTVGVYHDGQYPSLDISTKKQDHGSIQIGADFSAYIDLSMAQQRNSECGNLPDFRKVK